MRVEPCPTSSAIKVYTERMETISRGEFARFDRWLNRLFRADLA